MNDFSSEPVGSTETARLLAYVADLELEVDRLRRQGRFLEKAATETLTRILRLCTAPKSSDPLPTLADVEATARNLVEVVRDLHDSPGYHPAHDQVVAIAVRPLIERVFRWQQRLIGAPGVRIKLDLDPDHIEWFPARFRHILDNLIAHALRFRDPSAAEAWVSVSLRTAGGAYELRVADNGTGQPQREDQRVLALFYRVAPAASSWSGPGLAVVNMLVEQSGGTLTSGKGPGTEFVLTLPRYDLLDYLE